ncbi:glycosyltransferase family 4 protein [Humibacter soli]
MRRLSVLELDHTAQEGGAELALLRVAEVLRNDDDLELRVLLFSDGPLRARLVSAGVQTAVLPLDEGIATASRDRIIAGAARSALSAAKYVPRLARAIRGSHADVVVANSLKSAVFAFLAAPLAGRRWVWQLHDRLATDYLPAPLVAATRLIAVLGPRAIVVNSRATLETLPASARRKAVVAYPGLPPEAFTRAEPASGDVVVGILGRISPTKGQREFLEAAAIVAAAREDVRFTVIGGALFGEDGYEAELRDLAERLGVADRVEFTGWVSDAPARLRELTLLVHASPTPEPFGQVIVEAMAAGVPVVATAAGGVPEILDENGGASDALWWTTATGVLVLPGDSMALAQAMESVLDDPVSASSRAQAARDDAHRRFTIAQTARTVLRGWRDGVTRSV